MLTLGLLAVLDIAKDYKCRAYGLRDSTPYLGEAETYEGAKTEALKACEASGHRVCVIDVCWHTVGGE